MKGIRKLFLGLVLLTLFGVGFKVQVRAAVNSVALKTDDGGKTYWTKDAAKIDVYFTTGSEDELYPTAVGIYEYKFELDGTDIAGQSFTAERTATTTEFKRNGTTVAEGTFNDIGNIPKGTILTDLGGVTGSKTYVLKLKRSLDGGAWGDVAQVSFTIKGFKITPSAKRSSTASDEPVVTFTPATAYVLEGDESPTFKADDKLPGFEFVEWKFGDNTVTNTFEDGKPTCKVTPTEDNISTDDLVAYYKNNTSANLTFTNKELEGAVIAKGQKIDPTRRFTLSGGYKYEDISDAADAVTIGGTSVTGLYKEKTGDSSGAIYFNAPNISSAEPQVLKIKMKDGRVFTRNVYVIDPNDVTVSLTPNTAQTISTGGSVVFTPSITPAISGVTYDYVFTPTTYKNYVTDSVSAGKLTLTGKSQTTTPVTVAARATFSIEGATDATKDSATVSVTVTSPVLTSLSNVFANEDLSVPLSQFVNDKNANIHIDSVTTQNSAGSYISVSPSSNALTGDIKIKGSGKTKEITKGIKVTSGATTLESNVTVYPKPTIAKGENGTSELNYVFKLTMPKGVYHDSTIIEDLSKAKLEFEGSKGKHVFDKSYDLENNDDLSKKNKDTVSISYSDMEDIIDKVAKDDDKEITVRAIADGDKEVASSKLKLYKIKFDKSAGASYTVNGRSISDYFYGIDGVSYSIKSTGPGSLDRNNSGEFNNGESITFKVEGARTLKAVYTGSSSSSSSGRQSGANGESMGDGYDDVPKTGESKTDIWILWTVLFISILGAGFLIWKRFGLARAIAEADEAVAHAEYEEQVKAAEKEKQEKLDMLKDLRNL